MRLVERDEAMELIPPIYEAMRRTDARGASAGPTSSGGTSSLHDAEWMRRGNGPKFIVVLEVDGEVRGYAIYRVKADWDERGPNNIVTMMEVLGLDAAAERALWEWLFGIDLVAPHQGLAARACRSRCCSSWPSLAGSGWPSAKACSCGSSTCPRRSRGAATTRPARSRSR